MNLRPLKIQLEMFTRCGAGLWAEPVGAELARPDSAPRLHPGDTRACGGPGSPSSYDLTRIQLRSRAGNAAPGVNPSAFQFTRIKQGARKHFAATPCRTAEVQRDVRHLQLWAMSELPAVLSLPLPRE